MLAFLELGGAIRGPVKSPDYGGDLERENQGQGASKFRNQQNKGEGEQLQLLLHSSCDTG